MFSRFSFKENLLGVCLDENGVKNLTKYKYQSCGSTATDRLFDHWWNFVVNYLTPLGVAPNVLTLLGFICILVASSLVLWFNASLDRAMPRWVYFACAALLFVYQTLDAIDGKQARRTRTSSPLGQLFDHGCDTFTSVLVPLIAAAVVRLGISLSSFAVIATVQAQLFLFCWWDLHFHVFPHCSGFLGVTEAQLVVIMICLSGGIFGPDVFLTTIPSDVWTYAPVVVQKLFSKQHLLLATPIPLSNIALTIAMSILGATASADAINGLICVPKKWIGGIQLLSSLSHLYFQYLFFFSSTVSKFPAIGIICITIASSIVAVRLELAAVANMFYSPFIWPVYPFHVAALCFTYSTIESLNLLVLFALLFWLIFYMWKLVTVNIRSICKILKISCFTIQ